MQRRLKGDVPRKVGTCPRPGHIGLIGFPEPVLKDLWQVDDTVAAFCLDEEACAGCFCKCDVLHCTC